jgi:hypothetical protein
MLCFIDAEDGLTGVEIDFSFNDEGSGSQQGASIEGNETGDQSPTPPRATATRIQGELTDERFGRMLVNKISFSCPVNASPGSRRSS